MRTYSGRKMIANVNQGSARCDAHAPAPPHVWVVGTKLAGSSVEISVVPCNGQ